MSDDAKVVLRNLESFLLAHQNQGGTLPLRMELSRPEAAIHDQPDLGLPADLLGVRINWEGDDAQYVIHGSFYLAEETSHEAKQGLLDAFRGEEDPQNPEVAIVDFDLDPELDFPVCTVVDYPGKPAEETGESEDGEEGEQTEEGEQGEKPTDGEPSNEDAS